MGPYMGQHEKGNKKGDYLPPFITFPYNNRTGEMRTEGVSLHKLKTYIKIK